MLNIFIFIFILLLIWNCYSNYFDSYYSLHYKTMAECKNWVDNLNNFHYIQLNHYIIVVFILVLDSMKAALIYLDLQNYV